MATFELPELSYDTSALEPHLSARILELHHDEHHAAYVKKANAALERLGEENDDSTTARIHRELAFNLSGHLLHTRLWECMSPDGGGDPDGDLAAALTDTYGSVDRFRQSFNAVAATTQGSGWAVLSWEPRSRRLLVEQVHDHQSDTIRGASPLLVLDMWEHAYYLQYENRSAEWIEAFWNIVNWSAVAAAFEQDRQIELQPARR